MTSSTPLEGTELPASARSCQAPPTHSHGVGGAEGPSRPPVDDREIERELVERELDAAAAAISVDDLRLVTHVAQRLASGAGHR